SIEIRSFYDCYKIFLIEEDNYSRYTKKELSNLVVKNLYHPFLGHGNDSSFFGPLAKKLSKL
ncbi:hypothetical protein, partial [Bacillus thuringiensis]|uniref:hypothetical protein n=1 Tax=Bacillus thuringiensis TaxID=1428 RepID=UPI002AB3823F